jgi:cell wall-associated NlpC family hydrolase
MAGDGTISGTGLVAVLAGSVFLYAGIRGKSVLGSVQAVISGKSPETGPAANTISAPTEPVTPAGQTSAGGTIPGTALSNNAIAAAAEASIGHPYLYSGVPGTNGKSPWDCSSAVNYWTAVNCGLPIPGFPAGSWTGTSHGPATGSWLLWGYLQHVARKDVIAGDILVYQTHMGVAISNTDMVSAEDRAQGTQQSSIDGMTSSLGEVLFCRRYPQNVTSPGGG